MILPRGSILNIDGVDWTEHNRSSLNLSPERIENNIRMVNGTARKNYVADKYTISTSWSMVPSVDGQTADKKLGAWGMQDFYDSPTGRSQFTVVLKYDATVLTRTMYFDSFSMEVVKRSIRGYDLCNVSLTLEEV